MTTLAAVELSGEAQSVVVAEVEATGNLEVLARVNEPGGSLRLPSLLFDAAAQAGLGPRELGMIALGTAPQDPRTTRVGMGLLRAYAAVAKVPFVAISAVEALAFEARAGAPIGAILVPALALADGRVATATFAIGEAGRITRVLRECNVAPSEWVRLLAEAKLAFALGFGTGYAANRELVSELLPELAEAPSRPSAFGVALAAAMLARGGSPAPA